MHLLALWPAQQALRLGLAILNYIAAAYPPDTLEIVTYRQESALKIDIDPLKSEAFAHAQGKCNRNCEQRFLAWA